MVLLTPAHPWLPLSVFCFCYHRVLTNDCAEKLFSVRRCMQMDVSLAYESGEIVVYPKKMLAAVMGMALCSSRFCGCLDHLRQRNQTLSLRTCIFAVLQNR